MFQQQAIVILPNQIFASIYFEHLKGEIESERKPEREREKRERERERERERRGERESWHLKVLTQQGC